MQIAEWKMEIGNSFGNELQGERKIPSSAEEGWTRHQEKVPDTL